LLVLHRSFCAKPTIADKKRKETRNMRNRSSQDLGEVPKT